MGMEGWGSSMYLGSVKGQGLEVSLEVWSGHQGHGLILDPEIGFTWDRADGRVSISPPVSI